MTQALRTLAELYDLEITFTDATGRDRHAPQESVAAVLGSLGAPVTRPAAAVRAERLRRHLQIVEPVIAIPAAEAQVVGVSLPRSVHPRDCWLSVEREDGTTARTRLMPAVQRPVGSTSVEGRPMDRYEAGVPGWPLPPGYHHLRVEGPGVDASSMVVVAPRCPVPERGWGAFLPLHSLRTQDDWGVGNYAALRLFAQWVAHLGGGLVGVLPLYPLLLDGAGETSPYLPATRLGWNELYVDPTALPELEVSQTARQLLTSVSFAAELAAVRRNPLVDYPTSASLVRRALEPLARALFAGPSPRRKQLEAFARERPDMVAYARFRAGLDVRPLAGVDLRHATGSLDEAARYHLYAQWVASQQLAAAGDDLFLDLPVGVHPEGFDTSWEPAVFAEGVEGGAPPDAFFVKGQRWGFRPLHPRALRDQEYRHPIAVLRHAMSRSKVLRLDHVMGLHRLYWIPVGAEATDGVYVRYKDAELRAIVRLEAHRSGTAIVGEDLGTVPPGVRRSMGQDRMLRSWVLQFELSPDAPLPDPPELAMASIGTHDLPRFAAFWDGPGRSRWRRALGGDARRALRACLDHLAAGPARLVLVDVEDLWLERRPHNRPGTGPEAGNWRHRSARTLEVMEQSRDVTGAFERIDALRRQEVGE